MKRDMDLVRDILIFIESCEGEIDLNKMDTKHSLNTIELHVELMCEAGLVEAVISPSIDGPGHYLAMCKVNRITWFGHEFLDASRDEKRWKKAKDWCLKEFGGLTLDALKHFLLTNIS